MTKSLHSGNIIKILREARGIKAASFAMEMNSGWTDRDVEQMEQSPMIQADILQRVAKILNVDPEVITRSNEEEVAELVQRFNEALKKYYPRQHSVHLVSHSSEWKQVASYESDKLRKILGDNLVATEHFGSTSIAGISAKPVIDLMPLVRNINLLDEHHSLIESIGYHWHGDFGIPGRRFCTRDNQKGEREIHLHFYESFSPQVTRHLAFRDYLTAHPEQAKAYENEKINAARIHPNNSIAYNEEKGKWISEWEAEAIIWYEKFMIGVNRKYRRNNSIL